MQPANYRISMIIGKRGYGKTGTLIRDVMPEYIATRYKQFGKIKIGIYDLEHNYNYHKFECLSDKDYPKAKKDLLKTFCANPVPVVTIQQFSLLKAFTVRILPGNDETAGKFVPQAFTSIVNDRKLRECLIAIEDAARFMPDNNRLDTDLRDMIINAKQRSMDICLLFHDWSDVPPKLIRWIDEIYLHKTDTSAEYRKKDLGPHKYNLMLQAEKEVNAHPDKYFHKKIILNE